MATTDAPAHSPTDNEECPHSSPKGEVQVMGVDFIDRNALDGGTAYRQSDVPSGPDFRHVAIASGKILWGYGKKMLYDLRYQHLETLRYWYTAERSIALTTAHELGHALGNLDHPDLQNCEQDSPGASIMTQQCIDSGIDYFSQGEIKKMRESATQ